MQKKRQKLLIQVAVITFFIFTVAVLFTVVTDYNITKNAFLSSKNEMMSRDLYQFREYSFDMPSLSWLFQYLEDHPEYEIDRESTEEEVKLSSSSEYVDLYSSFFDEKKFNPEDADETTKMIIENDALHIMAHGLLYGMTFNYDRISVLDILNEKESYLLLDLDLKAGEDEAKRGGVISYPASEHSAVQQVLDGKVTDPKQTLFEVYHDPSNGKDYYNGYLPLFDGKEIAGLICVQYDWSSYHSDLLRHSRNSMLLGLFVFLALNALLLLFLYHQAISPLLTVTKRMQDYKNTKDSTAVSEGMRRISVKNEIGALAEDFSDLATEIDRYTDEILSLNEEKTRIGAELDMAAGIQSGSLPRVFPERSEFDLYASMDPAKEVGGDFYDFFLLDENRLAIVVADVSGKGVPAALFMMISKTLIRSAASETADPAVILSRTNDTLAADNAQAMFVTTWLGILDIDTGVLTYADAGHEKPVLFHDGTWSLLEKDSEGLPLGVFDAEDLALMDGSGIENRSLTMMPGDVIFQYSDGVPEAVNAAGEMFGEERMVKACEEASAENARELIAGIQSRLDDFVREESQFDDITMLALFYRGGSSLK